MRLRALGRLFDRYRPTREAHRMRPTARGYAPLGMSTGKSTAAFEVELPLAASTARHLSMFAELPSTPEAVAGEAAKIARDVASRLPSPTASRSGHHSGAAPQRHASPQAPVTLDRETVVASAGLLDMLAAMPSTPPVVREEAERTAESLWGVAVER